MWLLRRMLKVHWMDNRTNKEILQVTETEPSLLATIKKRQMNLFTHMIRKDRLENQAVAGRVEGTRPRRKQEIDNNIELLRTLEIVQSGGLWPKTQHHIMKTEMYKCTYQLMTKLTKH